jgi:hypothetical protein
LTLYYCEIFYLSAVNYDPTTTVLIFIRVIIYPGPEEGANSYFSVYFVRVSIYPAAIPYNINRGHYSIYPARVTSLVWLVSRPLFTLGLSAFAMI